MPDDGKGAPSNDGSSNGDDKGGATPPEGYISKQEHEKNVGDLKQQLEDLKLEIVTPEYIQFLEGKKAPAPEKKEAPGKEDEVDFTGWTPKQIAKYASEEASKAAKAETERLRSEFSTTSQASIKKEIETFARATPDFEKYRPLMQGLSTLAKNKDLSLSELYKLAKEHAKSFGATEDDKDKGRRAGGERPGGSTPSVKKDVKYSADSAAEEAWGEIVGEKGLQTQ